MSEAGKRLLQVLDRTIAKHLGLAVIDAAEPFGQMSDQLGQFVGKRLLGELHRFVEPGRDS